MARIDDDDFMALIEALHGTDQSHREAAMERSVQAMEQGAMRAYGALLALARGGKGDMVLPTHEPPQERTQRRPPEAEALQASAPETATNHAAPLPPLGARRADAPQLTFGLWDGPSGPRPVEGAAPRPLPWATSAVAADTAPQPKSSPPAEPTVDEITEPTVHPEALREAAEVTHPQVVLGQPEEAVEPTKTMVAVSKAPPEPPQRGATPVVSGAGREYHDKRHDKTFVIRRPKMPGK